MADGRAGEYFKKYGKVLDVRITVAKKSILRRFKFQYKSTNVNLVKIRMILVGGFLYYVLCLPRITGKPSQKYMPESNISRACSHSWQGLSEYINLKLSN